MLILRSGNGYEYRIEKYKWDAGPAKPDDYCNGREVGTFKCTLIDVDVGLVAEAVKGGGSWWSTDGGGCPYSVCIEITEDMLTATATAIGEQTITFEHVRYYTWDHKGYDVIIEGVYVV